MPFEGELIAIRLRLLGGKEAAAEAEEVTTAIKETGAAAEESSTQSAAAARKTEASSANATRALKKQAAFTRELGMGLTKWVTGPLLAIGGASIYMASNFKRQMGLVATDAGGTTKEVAHLEGAVLGLARSSEFGPRELAQGLFHAESAGYRGAKAMTVMRNAAELATVGGAGFEETMYSLVSATKALGREGPAAIRKTASELNQIIAHGDIRLPELNAALSTGLLPTTRALGLSVQSVGSALDVMTARGMPAQKSAYALNFVLQKLVPSTEKAEKVFEGLGIGQEQLLKTAQRKGLPAALGLLKSKIDELPQGQQIKTIDEMFGGGRMSKGLLTVIQNLGEMKRVFGELNPDVALYNKHVKEAEGQPLVRMKRAWSSVEADMVELGGRLLPIVVPLFEKASGFVVSIADDFEGLSPAMKSAVGDAVLLAGALGPLILLGGKLEKVWTGARAVFGASSAAEGVATGGGLGARLGVAGLIAGGGTIAAQAGAQAIGGKLGGWVGNVGTGAALGAGIGTAILPGFGTLVGGGIGASAGAVVNIIHSLNGSEKELSVTHLRLARDGKVIAEGMREQRVAGLGLVHSEDRVQTAQARSRTSSRNLARARQAVNQAIRRYGADSRPAVQAERHLTEVIEGHRQAVRRLHAAERLRGVELSEYKTLARENVLNERNEINVLTRRGAHLNAEYLALRKSGASRAEVNTKAREATAINGRLRNAQIKNNETLLEAAHVAGPAFSKFLKGANRELLEAGSAMGAFDTKVEQLGELSGRLSTPLGNALNPKVSPHGLKLPKGKSKGGAGKKAAAAAAQSRRTGPASAWDRSPDSRPTEYWAPTGDAARSSGAVRHMQPITIQVGRRTLANLVAETQQDDEARL